MNFAGTLTGSILEEQVHALGEYVTSRTRGGLTVQDTFLSPTTKTPYTDELPRGDAVDLGHSMRFDALDFTRRTRDIFEDYDVHLDGDPDGCASLSGVPGDPTAPDSLFLGYDSFGDAGNPGSSFVPGTLAGGKRNCQGDVPFLDPRAPNQFGAQRGLIRNVLKRAGPYTFPFGFQL